MFFHDKFSFSRLQWQITYLTYYASKYCFHYFAVHNSYKRSLVIKDCLPNATAAIIKLILLKNSE